MENNSQVSQNSIFQTKWEKYEKSSSELPSCKCCNSFYLVRWCCLSPFRIRVYRDISIGDILCFLAFSAFTVYFTVTSIDFDTQGQYSGLLFGLVFLLGMRNSIFTFILGISYEQQLFWHKFVTICAIVLGVQHAVNSSKDEKPKDLEEGDEEKDEGYYKSTGAVLLLATIAIVVTSLLPIRRHFFSCFLRMHYVLISIITVTAILHSSIITFFTAVIFIIELIFRGIVIIKNKKKTEKVTIKKISDSVVEIRASKFKGQYKAGQFYFICVPRISYFQWHPISIASSPYEEDLLFYIKNMGSWSKQLLKLVEEKGEIETNVYIGGSYGTECIDLDSEKYQDIMFFSGGIGVTPMKSLADNIYFDSLRGRKVRSIDFIWSCRDEQLIKKLPILQEKPQNKYYEKQKSAEAAIHPDPVESAEKLESVKVQINKHYFFTKKQSDEEKQGFNIDQNTKIHSKRPDIKDIFTKKQEQLIELKKSQNISNKIKVGVLVCGPDKLTEDVLKYAQILSNNGVQFDVHSSIFEF